MRFSGDGRVSKDGVYHHGGSSSSWGTASPVAVQELLTVSLQQKDDYLQSFCSLGGSSSTTSWSGFSADDFDALIIQKLVTCDQGPRSFNQDTILPLLKIYDPRTAEDKQVAGKTITTHAGGLIVLCPKSRETDLEQLRSGETPSNFDPRWVAMEAGSE
jgi:hypothetical protein